jgi:hypothetical protein
LEEAEADRQYGLLGYRLDNIHEDRKMTAESVARSLLKIILFCLLFLFCLGVVLNLLPRKPDLLKKIDLALEAGRDNVRLQEFTDFQWDEVCFFRKNTSYPTSAYDSYKEYIDTIPLDIEPLPSGFQDVIFLFRSGTHYRQFTFRTPVIKVNKDHYVLAIDTPKPPPGYTPGDDGCLSQPVFVHRQLHSDILLLTHTKE